MDTVEEEWQNHNFLSLGIKEVIFLSAKENRNIDLLLAAATQGWKNLLVESSPATTVAIIGRTNVGKSTLLNFLAKEERCIISPLAGTTRDSVDFSITWEGIPFTFVDTAGIRRKNKEKESIDKFASLRTWKAIARADICLLLLDSLQGMTEQEKRIANEIVKQEKGCILFFNKWDLAKEFRMEHAMEAIKQEVPFFMYCPVLFGSAQTGRNMEKIFPTIQIVSNNLNRRISTGKLNSLLRNLVQAYHPPMIQGKRLRIYYMTQVKSNPPHFILFVNHPRFMTSSYQRYLINNLRKAYDFSGCPLKMELRAKEPRQNPTFSKMQHLQKEISFAGIQELVFEENS